MSAPESSREAWLLMSDLVLDNQRRREVADAYEAMTAERVYKAAMPAAEAEAELRRQSGSQFDAEVVDALLGAIAIEHPAGADAGAVAQSGSRR